MMRRSVAEDGLDRSLGDFGRRFVLPRAQAQPSGLCQASIGVVVARPVARDFAGPVLAVRFGAARAVDRASVPEAAVDEHSDFRWSENEVRSPAHAR